MIFFFFPTPPQTVRSPRRFAGRVEVHHQGHGTAAPDRLVGVVRHHHIRHHRARVLLRSVAQDLLQVRKRDRVH